jgi:hypothetical protein
MLRPFRRKKIICVRKIVAVVTILGLSGCGTVVFKSAAVGPESAERQPYIVDSSYYHIGDRAASAAKIEHEGELPIAWGRYIYNEAGSDYQRNGFKELTVSEIVNLGQSGEALVPIVAPDQTSLRGTFEDGSSLAYRSAAAIVGLLRMQDRTVSGKQVLVFLDVESDKYPISDEFLLGWGKGLKEASQDGVKLLPGIYTNGGLAAKGVRLTLARVGTEAGVRGLWLAHYTSSPEVPKAWPDMRTDVKKLLPPIPDEIPIVLWQYYSRPKSPELDYSMVNPGIAGTLDEMLLHFGATQK